MRWSFQVAQHVEEEVVRVRKSGVAILLGRSCRSLAIIEYDDFVDAEDRASPRYLAG